MKKLTLDTFIASADDFEKSQYEILGILKKYNSQLHKNKVYPVLSELMDISQVLEEILKGKNNLEKVFPKLIRNNSLAKTQDEENTPDILGDVDKVFDFINWAYPKIQEAIAEGKALYSFVKENLKIDEIGIVPLYKNEGYFFITDHKSNKFNIYRYEIPFITQDMNSNTAIRIQLLKSFDNYELKITSENDLKIQLTKENDLPNPATFKMNCELDFPFEETILPIAKRRLVKMIAA